MWIPSISTLPKLIPVHGCPGDRTHECHLVLNRQTAFQVWKYYVIIFSIDIWFKFQVRILCYVGNKIKMQITMGMYFFFLFKTCISHLIHPSVLMRRPVVTVLGTQTCSNSPDWRIYLAYVFMINEIIQRFWVWNPHRGTQATNTQKFHPVHTISIMEPPGLEAGTLIAQLPDQHKKTYLSPKSRLNLLLQENLWQQSKNTCHHQ